MITKKDLVLNDEYLNSLVQYSRRKDMSAFNDFAPLNESQMHTRTDIVEEYNQASKEPTVFTLVTQIAFPLTCRCGFSWTYKPRQYDPPT